MITLSIRYTIEARKRLDFERYARTLTKIVPRCGGELVGYWLPTKYAGPTNEALALISFPSLAAYEQYRERLAKDADSIEAIRRAEESACILVEDRAILEPADHVALIVEDDPKFARVLVDLAHDSGFKAVIAPNASGALEAQLDIALVDYLGDLAEGRLVRGDNPVLMTMELVLEPLEEVVL